MGRQLVEKFVDAGQSVRIFDLPQMDFSGLEDNDSIEINKGDITNADDVTRSVDGVDAVLHLAAILPPNSERNRDVTFRVNVGGTENIIRALEKTNPDAMLVFTSSISTYGDTSTKEPPVKVTNSQSAIDIYADSKIEGERIMRESCLTNTVSLRTAAIAVPAFLEPPDPWPFMEDQRVEMVHRRLSKAVADEIPLGIGDVVDDAAVAHNDVQASEMRDGLVHEAKGSLALR